MTIKDVIEFKECYRKDIHFKNYYEALFGKDMKVKMNTFRSYAHKLCSNKFLIV